MRRMFLIGVALGLPIAPALAQEAGQQPSWATPAAQPAPPTGGLPSDSPIPANPYVGVVPGRPNPPPRLARIHKARRTLVTWPGFQMTGAGSRIFVQTSGAVSFEDTRGPNRLVILFRNCRIHTRNNRNPLITRHFNTPVAKAYLVRRRRDVELVVELRSQVVPMISEGAGEGGFRFVFVDFPAGSYLPAGEVAVPSWRPSSAPPLQQGDDEMPPPIEPPTGAGPPQ